MEAYSFLVNTLYQLHSEDFHTPDIAFWGVGIIAICRIKDGL